MFPMPWDGLHHAASASAPTHFAIIRFIRIRDRLQRLHRTEAPASAPIGRTYAAAGASKAAASLSVPILGRLHHQTLAPLSFRKAKYERKVGPAYSV